MLLYMLLLAPMLDLKDTPPKWGGAYPTLEACLTVADRKNFKAGLWMNEQREQYEAGWRFVCVEIKGSA